MSKRVMVGYDASGLEDRIKCHYLYKIDGGEFSRRIMAEGYDPHQESADLWNMSEQRGRAKNGNYALQYLCQPPTLAKTLGCPLRDAQVYWDDYWKLNWALDEFVKQVERAWIRNNKQFVLTIDGSKIYTRAKHSLANCVIQSTGAKVMDLSGVFMDKWVVARGIDAYRVLYMHDEYQWICWEEDAELIGQLGVKSIIKAGEYFKLNVKLDAEYMTGETWADCH